MPKFNVEQSIEIDAPIEKVYETVLDLKQWNAWSPWMLAEPDCPIEYAGDGKSYSWKGKIIGAGELIITNESAPGRIDYALNFLKPWKSKNTSSFLFRRKDGGTEVSWTMVGSLSLLMFFMKTMMTAFVGMDYKRGLMMLKDYVETGANPSKLEFVPNVNVSGQPYIGIRADCALDEVDSQMEKDVMKLLSWLREQSAEPTGPAFSIYHKWDMVRQRTDYTLCFPLQSLPENVSAPFTTGELASGPAYTVRHTGPYRHLGNAWSAGMMHGRAKVYKADKKRQHFEVYENNPQDVGENELVTVVHFPVR